MQHGDITARQLRRLYRNFLRQITPLLGSLHFNPQEPFSFLNNPAANALINELLRQIAQQISLSIEKNSIKAWESSIAKNEKRFAQYLQSGLLKSEELLHYNTQNKAALRVFNTRKVNGLKLSERIWNLTKQFKTELEMSLDVGLLQGKSAKEIALDVMEYLHHPNELLRQVGKARGSRYLSQAVQKMKEADPVLGSSFNKAMRLARTEVNMAYRSADMQQYRTFGFVLGYEIKRSANTFGCPVCEALKGEYPKEFEFVGWHPNCRCYTVPILQPWDDFLQNKQAEPLTDVSENFKAWARDNYQRMEKAQSVPYWWRDNKKYVEKNIKQAYEVLHKNSIFAENLERVKNKENLPDIDIEKINAIHLYTGSYHRDINRFLRKQTHTIDENIGLNKEYYEAITKTINSALDDLPKYQGTTYRATTLSKEVLGQYKKAFKTGKPYIDKAFFSTSYDKDILKHSYFKGNVEFQTTSKNGVNIEKIAIKELVNEVLFKAGTKFKVTDFKFKNNIYIINLKEL